MEASGGKVRLFTYSHASGRDAYIKTAQFVIFLAMKRIYPSAITKMSCTLGESVYFNVSGAEDFDTDVLIAEINK